MTSTTNTLPSSMTLADAEAAGIAQIAALMGAQQGAAIRALADDADTALTGRGAAIAFGEIYRPGTALELKTRELVTVAVLASLGHAEPQLRVHLRAALAAGASRAEIFAVLDQLYAYVGFPTALNALAVAREVLGESSP
ncbi:MULTISPECIES: carboxymuconolactone decarboxylase family protein [Xanthomonas]|uniref:Carboxymuconolactone decarboxylase family protein n=1 Tax=Xanthomonas rydalmerensis TaxID=3046274 RepID=A0ABZ0JKX8_9XANT|nr:MULTISPECIES: carboxymuconolactone decarboxylase family protein [unclassified Xanthomonas]MBB5941810.1 4-carboxymuconolactone decarboxylase [Xanthomonas sp. 3307]WOS40436.1 carboxymuconolactone decarboxylase family protein [Xanthomonas sp. DM-2023]WOS44620.1 carboxymuconolactone decarboxylase family protein [Xanthomonas sp. DM-2023]WOS48800.1 carboxymuconolactone decarboxylase family protein [Xanthomonas sp. DM-2023]WOS52980.1 carboxymuconolactone decarboxylase family protein [Xanthomonas s